MQNDFTTAIPAAVLTQVQTAITQIVTALKPYLQPLTPQERQDMLKMGDKTVAFVQKTRDYAAQNPAFVPAFVSLPDFKIDADALLGLAPLRQQLESLALDTDSTLMVAGSDAYAEALTIYKNIKFLAENNQPGAQAAYDDLRQRFPGSANAGRRRKPLTAA
jgi:hypothetical protein